jgi:hypothetical protein
MGEDRLCNLILVLQEAVAITDTEISTRHEPVGSAQAHLVGAGWAVSLEFFS